jgi:hypothetical protein
MQQVQVQLPHTMQQLQQHPLLLLLLLQEVLQALLVLLLLLLLLVQKGWAVQGRYLGSWDRNCLD